MWFTSIMPSDGWYLLKDHLFFYLVSQIMGGREIGGIGLCF